MKKVIFDVSLNIPGVGAFNPGDEAEVSLQLFKQLVEDMRVAHEWRPTRRTAPVKENEHGE